MTLLAAVFLALPLFAQEDPYLWLEEVESPKALEWVVKQNSATLAAFETDAHYPVFKKQAEDLLQAKDRIPYGVFQGGFVYNLWQDEKYVRGLWRRATLEEYQKENPAWETLLDVDALAEKEKENWVHKGSSCLPPKQNPCLIYLSRGGKDAIVIREFDVEKKDFVQDGFNIAEAKTNASWLDENTLLVGSDFGPGTLTDSGYARTIRQWKRGTPLKKAPVVFEGEKTDVGMWPVVFFRPEGKTVILDREIAFYRADYWLMSPDGKKTKLPLQTDAQINGIFQNKFLVGLRSSWTVSGQTLPQGALAAMDLSDLKNLKVDLLYTPDERSALQGAVTTKSAILINVLNNVKGEIRAFDKILPFPQGGTLEFISYDDFSDVVFARYEDFLTPTSLYLYSKGEEPKVIKRLPARFDASKLVSEQYEAVSKDGTKIPYFVVRPKDSKLDGKNPTLMYGYGGFEWALTPTYSPTTGKLWLENGGTYVLANIRGGNEFGPRWHKAGLKENRQKVFDDFISVGEDVIRRGISSPRHLGIMGGSNGGLLMGAVFTQRPELFNAVVCQVPLLDMLRYHKLLAGASWMGEYGDPEDANLRPFIAAYSPYQNVRKDKKYPRVFFNTSTKDDRVHPGHARKMVAKMQEMGHPVYYFENIEGGHSAASNLLQLARRRALEYVYLFQRLK